MRGSVLVCALLLPFVSGATAQSPFGGDYWADVHRSSTEGHTVSVGVTLCLLPTGTLDACPDAPHTYAGTTQARLEFGPQGQDPRVATLVCVWSAPALWLVFDGCLPPLP